MTLTALTLRARSWWNSLTPAQRKAEREKTARYMRNKREGK